MRRRSTRFRPLGSLPAGEAKDVGEDRFELASYTPKHGDLGLNVAESQEELNVMIRQCLNRTHRPPWRTLRGREVAADVAGAPCGGRCPAPRSRRRAVRHLTMPAVRSSNASSRHLTALTGHYAGDREEDPGAAVDGGVAGDQGCRSRCAAACLAQQFDAVQLLPQTAGSTSEFRLPQGVPGRQL